MKISGTLIKKLGRGWYIKTSDNCLYKVHISDAKKLNLDEEHENIQVTAELALDFDPPDDALEYVQHDSINFQ